MLINSINEEPLHLCMFDNDELHGDNGGNVVAVLAVSTLGVLGVACAGSFNELRRFCSLVDVKDPLRTHCF